MANFPTLSLYIHTEKSVGYKFSLRKLLDFTNIKKWQATHCIKCEILKKHFRVKHTSIICFIYNLEKSFLYSLVDKRNTEIQ